MSSRKIPVLEIPYFMRSILSIPQGTLYVSREKGVVKNINVDATIGDVVSTTLKSRVRVIDYKTRRYRVLRHGFFKEFIRIVNPPGTISLNALTLLAQIKFLPRNIVIDGEEDLIPLSIIRNNGCKTIAYGQPGVGVVVIERNMCNLFRSREILKTFKPVMYAYTPRVRVVEQ